MGPLVRKVAPRQLGFGLSMPGLQKKKQLIAGFLILVSLFEWQLASLVTLFGPLDVVWLLCYH